MRIRRNKKGFTLVELIVVIAILAVLAAVATVSVTAIVNNARQTSIQNDLNQYKSAYQAYVNLGSPGTFQAFVTSGDYQISAEGATHTTTTVVINRNGYRGTLTLATGAVTIVKV